MSLDKYLLLERPLIGLDLETTGMGKTARIVEIGLEIMKPTEPTKIWRTLVDPEVPIPLSATEVHGITDSDVHGCRKCHEGASEHPREGCDAFLPWPTFGQLAANLAMGMTNVDFAGYSVEFDLRVLVQEFTRVQVPWTYEGARHLDSLRVWQVLEPRKLEDAALRWLGQKPDRNGSHSARQDVVVSTAVLAEQLRANPQLPRTVPALFETCYPDRYDHEGKLRWRDGELVLGFGKHRDTALTDVPRDYLQFIIRKDFSDKVKHACREVLAGREVKP